MMVVPKALEGWMKSRIGCRGLPRGSGPDFIKVPSGTSSAALGRLWAVDHRKPPDTSGHSGVGSRLVITGYSPSSVLKLSGSTPPSVVSGLAVLRSGEFAT